MKARNILSVSALLAAALWVSSAHAEAVAVSKNVQKKLKGKVYLTDDPVQTNPEDDSATVKAFEKANKIAFKHTEADGVPAWTFHYTAFLSKPAKDGKVAFEFYTADKERLFVADKRLVGIDTTSTIIEGDMVVTEDDGLAKNRVYDVRVVGKIGKKDFIYAKTKLTTK